MLFLALLPEKYYFLAVNIGIILLPLLLSFDKRVAFYKKIPELLVSFLSTGVIFIVWDYYYVSQGFWGFNERYLMGEYIGNLPIEEILFYFTVIYASTFLYEALKVLAKKKFFVRSRFLTLLFMLTSWAVAYEYKYLQYTNIVFAFLGTLFFLNLISDRKFLMNFYVTFAMSLAPIIAVEAILTGTGLPEPIIWFGSSEHLGVNVLSIPLENIFYIMAFVLMNITIMESFNPVD